MRIRDSARSAHAAHHQSITCPERARRSASIRCASACSCTSAPRPSSPRQGCLDQLRHHPRLSSKSERSRKRHRLSARERRVSAPRAVSRWLGLGGRPPIRRGAKGTSAANFGCHKIKRRESSAQDSRALSWRETCACAASRVPKAPCHPCWAGIGPYAVS